MIDLTGTCFIDAIRYGVLLHQSGRAQPTDHVEVVHAIVNAGGGDFVHGWAEHNGRAWQGAYQDNQPVYIAAATPDFHRILNVREACVYSLDDAIALVGTTGHCGPWSGALLKAAEDCGRPRSVSGLKRLNLTEVIRMNMPHGIADFRKQILP